jgi:hypothetical protein
MPETILPNGLAPSPEFPITIRVDGNLQAVDFIRRLHRGGMDLRNAEDGSYAVIVLAERAPQPVSGVRRHLFQASGIVHAVRSALDCSDHIEIDEVQLASALEAAGKIVDNAADALEVV